MKDKKSVTKFIFPATFPDGTKGAIVLNSATVEKIRNGIKILGKKRK